MQIATGTPDDVAEITAIYAHHVLHGTGSYETTPPDTVEMTARLTRIRQAGWPWLVARDAGGELLGYAYISQFRDRAAYRFTAENSIYVRHDRRGQGIGQALLSALINAAQDCGFRQLIAVIGGAEPASIALHAAAGFVHAGRLRGIGRKHGRWLDNVYMQLSLDPGCDLPADQEPDAC